MTKFNFIKVIEQFLFTSNRFNRDNIIAGLKTYLDNNTELLERLNNAYLKQDRDTIAKYLEEYVRSIRAGDDVKYRTYQAICYILTHSNDSFLEEIHINFEPPVSKLHRQELILKDLLDGGQHIEELAEKYCVDERSIRNDIKHLRSGQDLVREYLGYLPDTGDMLGLNVDLKKDYVVSLAKVHPLKLLLTNKEMLALITALSKYIYSKEEFSQQAQQVLGEILRNSSGATMDILEQQGVKSNFYNLEDRVSTLKKEGKLIDANAKFNWRRQVVEVEYYASGKLIKESGKVVEIQPDSIIFVDQRNEQKEINMGDILEVICRE